MSPLFFPHPPAGRQTEKYHPLNSAKSLKITISQTRKEEFQNIAKMLLEKGINELTFNSWTVVKDDTPDCQKYEDGDFFYSFELEGTLFHVTYF